MRAESALPMASMVSCAPAVDAEQSAHPVTRAMLFLDSDREEAIRCLNDASVPLAWEVQGSHCGVTRATQATRCGGLARWQARRALSYIEDNLGSKLDTCTLANLLAFSKSHFSRAFKRSLGLPPMAYVTTRRIERAKVMMTSTREQLTQIALDCGFADQSHLNRSFLRRVGVSPGRWRRAQAEGVSSNPQSRK
jgi:AraC family transcriptional regulator